MSCHKPNKYNLVDDGEVKEYDEEIMISKYLTKKLKQFGNQDESNLDDIEIMKG